jgi:predicted TIM-barrel fold metal-dependent hydrolase
MFIDVHAHVKRNPEPWYDGKPLFSTPEQVLARYDELDIERGVLLPLVNAEVYLPQSNEEILQIAAESNGRFIPFCNIDPRALTNSDEAPLEYLLKYYKDRGCKGIGEVMPNMPFKDPLVQNLFKNVEKVRFPLIFDISTQIGGTYGLFDDVDLPQLEYSLQKFPDLIIIGQGPAFWAQIGQLEKISDRSRYPSYPIKEEGVVVKLMRKYPNLYADISARSGSNALARDPDFAVNFMNEFQDRLLFGTDICQFDMPIPQPDFLLNLRACNKLEDKVFVKIAKENTVKLLEL